MSGKLLITGAPKDFPQEEPFPRLEINDFIKDENIKQFALYVQALNVMFADTDAVRSFYEISGIHGRPYKDWNQSPSGGRGYCVHNSVHFITWHRPYVALLDQLLHDHASKIALQYANDTDEWKKAAGSLRQPYWDWKNNSVPPNKVIQDKKVTIPVPPLGEMQPIDNPFFQYNFKTGEREGFQGSFAGWPKSLRHPTSQGENAESDVNSLRRLLQASQDEFAYEANRLFSMTTWEEFSSNLENLHGKIHVRVGGLRGGGHMSQVPYAAFDPIFYLHHAQVDHVASQWYGQHRVWINQTRDLNPFWKVQTAYWQSPEVNQTGSILNYNYKDAPEPSPGPPVPLQRLNERTIQAYLPGSSGQTSPTTITEWSVRIHCKQFELGGSFSVLLFLGEVPAAPTVAEEWYYFPNFAGAFDVFANSEADECGNCRDRENVEIEGHVYINPAILKCTGNHSLEPATVLPLLRERAKLNWVVLKVGGDVAELPSLEVVVQTTPMTLPVLSGGMIPSVGKPTYYYDITYGRRGGSRQPPP
ncbi:hypothetical protein AX16_007421 [Volvariella volvacea WC 439]|uniref:tyrosinase n=1 Tax=Volvariella volvacea TaxID=36659 RepID=A0A977TF49_9AGAR|nr:hypothetical protein AX16_007421 [Volvariella volvacea WC 439]UXP86200.1 polyphenol oxidase 3 [Volvariella volvacea]